MFGILIITICFINIILASASDNLNFVVIGDWGGVPFPPYTTPGQKQTAVGMGIVANEINAEFIVALGDNFYFEGIKDVNSRRFDNTFHDVYTAESLQKPWYLIAGNHDHYGNITAQLEYTNVDETGKWNFPSLYHSKQFTAGNGDTRVTMDLILIDTVDLCSMSSIKDENEEGYYDPLPLRTKSQAANNGEQWQWIEDELKKSTADYIIVGGHFPVYSICQHGPTETLVTNLKPLLEQYGAHYLAGHDHCTEHLQEADQLVNYVITGTADFCCTKPENNNNTMIPKDSVKFYVAKDNHRKISDNGVYIGGFNSFLLNKQGMTINYHDQDGNILFTPPIVLPRV